MCATTKLTCPPTDKAYWPEYFRVNPLMNAEGGSMLRSCGAGCKSDCPKPPVFYASGNRWNPGSSVYMGAEGFYMAQGQTKCAIAHPFNKEKREQCEANHIASTRQTTKESEAALNNAIAQGILNKTNPQQGSGNNGNTVKIIAGVVLAAGAVVGLIVFAKKRKAAKMAAAASATA